MKVSRRGLFGTILGGYLARFIPIKAEPTFASYVDGVREHCKIMLLKPNDPPLITYITPSYRPKFEWREE